MTNEERAQIARENGAKSKGPVTSAGKEKSARNGITHGLRTEKLKHFIPPHHAVLCNEDRAEYYQLIDELLSVYQPVNSVAAGIVRDIAVARWQILRLDSLITNHWNLSLAEHAQKSLTVAPELGELQTMSRTPKPSTPATPSFIVSTAQIDQLNLRVARLERRLKFIHLNFRTAGNDQTQQQSSQPVENTTNVSPNGQETEQPIFITENTPEVIAYYKRHYPGREIVIQPADDVANGIDIEDDMPDIPRKAA